jgi:signal transduction histidine kinase
MKLVHAWPLVAVSCGVALVGYAARTWLHANAEQVDANDAAMLALADTALYFAFGASLLVVLLAHSLLDRQRLRLSQQLQKAQAVIHQRVENESHQRQMSMLGVLAGSLAHELGQPLSAARVGLEGLHYLRQLGRDPSPEHIESTLSRVGMSLLAMTQTIDHLRSLAGTPQTTRLETIDLVTQVDALLNDREQWLRYSDVRISWDKPSDPVPALGDAAGLRLIMTNLLRNAVEAVLGQTKERRLVRIVIGPGTMVAIHDSGPGMSDEIKKSLFEPLITTKNEGFHGIGLPLAKMSAARMGGSLTVTSHLGSGTTFTLSLLAPHETASLQIPELA